MGTPRKTEAATTIGRRLKALRIEQGKKAIEVAAELGMSKANYGHFETGRNRMLAEMLPDFARALSVEVDVLMTRLGLMPSRGLQRPLPALEDFNRLPESEQDAIIDEALRDGVLTPHWIDIYHAAHDETRTPEQRQLLYRGILALSAYARNPGKPVTLPGPASVKAHVWEP